MTALPEEKERMQGFAPMFLPKWDDLDAAFLDKTREQRSRIRPKARSEDDAGFGECGSSDGHGRSGRDGLGERFVSGLAEKDGHDRRTIDDHAPSGP